MNANTGRGARIRGEQLKSPALIRTHQGVSRDVNSPTPVTFPYPPLLPVAPPLPTLAPCGECAQCAIGATRCDDKM